MTLQQRRQPATRRGLERLRLAVDLDRDRRAGYASSSAGVAVDRLDPARAAGRSRCVRRLRAVPATGGEQVGQVARGRSRRAACARRRPSPQCAHSSASSTASRASTARDREGREQVARARRARRRCRGPPGHRREPERAAGGVRPYCRRSHSGLHASAARARARHARVLRLERAAPRHDGVLPQHVRLARGRSSSARSAGSLPSAARVIQGIRRSLVRYVRRSAGVRPRRVRESVTPLHAHREIRSRASERWSGCWCRTEAAPASRLRTPPRNSRSTSGIASEAA